MRDETTYGFRKADAEALVQKIGNGQRSFRQGLVRGNSSVVRAFATPGGGIAARSGSTLGSATCTQLTLEGGTRATTTNSVTVYNDFTTAIGGSADIIATRIDGIWVAIAEDCA